jgi:murein L,D-transpeptidase YafK
MTQKLPFRKGFPVENENVTVRSQDFHTPVQGGKAMRIIVEKHNRRLTVYNGDSAAFSCRAALGRVPVGPKRAEGDGRTPEGGYRICLVKPEGKYGRSLGLSYPSEADGQLALQEGRIDARTMEAIRLAHMENRRPPWGSPLGGEIYIHEGGSASDWTQGCIALEREDMDRLFPLWEEVEEVVILP